MLFIESVYIRKSKEITSFMKIRSALKVPYCKVP